jgi:hypothetical protein
MSAWARYYTVKRFSLAISLSRGVGVISGATYIVPSLLDRVH